jgi:hypothetical protein
MRETLAFIRKQPALIHALAGGTVFTFWAWGLMWWTPSFLVRSHQMSLGDAGSALAWINGVGGTSVLLATAWLMGRLRKRDARLVPWLTALFTVLGTLPSIVAYTTESTRLAIAMLWIFIPLSYLNIGPTFSLVQNLVPPGMRAQISAVLLFVANIANLVLAPQLVGIASDALAPAYGIESLRYALIPITLTGFWAAWHYWAVAKDLRPGMLRAGAAP